MINKKINPVLGQVDHVALAVRDADISAKFFVEVLGMKIIGDDEVPDAGVRLVYLDAGNISIQLVQPRSETAAVARWLSTHPEGLHHVCFQVDDIPSTLAALPEESKQRIITGGRNYRTCFLKNEPSGLLIELTETEEK